MQARWSWGRRGAALVGIAALAGAIAGVYVSLVWFSKDQSQIAVECVDTPAAVARAAPFVRGEVAALRTATNPELLTDIVFTDPEGAETSLAAFAGRTVLVNLWATWCVPCRTEMPTLDNLEGALGGDEFSVVAINIDLNNPERARAFFEEIGVNHLEFYSDSDARVFAGLKGRGLAFGLPVTLLLDKNGCRIASIDGPAEWDSEDAKALIAAAIGPG
jgi:thiol-disulfide isomerase/thioredoxin